MKTKIATALSLVGVLGAGSAAALVNTQILDSGPAGADTSAILTPTPAPQQVNTTAASTSSSSTSTTAASTTAVTTTTLAPVVVTPAAAPAASPFLTSYNVGEAGLVTVDVVSGVTTVVSTTPNPGWTVTSTESDPSQNKVEVKLSNGTQLVELEVRFDGTQLLPEVSSAMLDASGNTIPNTVANTVANTVTGNTIDDDDDDETHNTVDDDDDDHDDDHGGDDDDHDDD